MPKNAIFILIVAFLSFLLSFSPPPAAAQKDKKPAQVAGPLLTRTTPRHESHRLPYGGTVSIVGAPDGSVTIEGWQRSEIDISAEIELHAASAADLDRLAVVNNFSVDVDTNHIRVLTTGTHDKKFLKRFAKDFPKTLIGLPWKIDYHIKIPALTDLEIDAGNGPIKVSGVEGAIRINAVAGAGNINVLLSPGFSGDINADVLRVGEVKNAYPNLEPRGPNGITPRSIRARASSGGGTLEFTVGDGTIQITQAGEG